MADSVEEKNVHWSDEAEAIKSNKPLKFLLILFKLLPTFVVHLFCIPVSFFFFIFVSHARHDARDYQKQLKKYTNGKVPLKISGYQQILSFSLCILEKMEGWLGKVKFDRIRYQNDDVEDILQRLREGKGALLLTSHLGNMELLRSLQDYNTQLCGRVVPVVVVMDMKVSEQFTNTMKEVNPNYSVNIVNSSDIGPDSMIYLQEQAEQGALIVIAGDRTSANNRDKNIVKDFLGKPASFPYGVFLLLALMKIPVYYMFGMRSKMSFFNPKYNIYIEKSKIDFDCPRSERETRIKDCCGEFVEKLEKFCKMYPYQWYNFFNFWN